MEMASLPALRNHRKYGDSRIQRWRYLAIFARPAFARQGLRFSTRNNRYGVPLLLRASAVSRHGDMSAQIEWIPRFDKSVVDKSPFELSDKV
jgi:hypothetical protein